MPGDFLDTSALAKHYHAEIGSDVVDQLWDDGPRKLFISRLSVLEMASVFAGKIRAGRLVADQFDVLRRRFAADLAKSKRLIGVRPSAMHFKDAESLIRKHGPFRRLRTLDALQLAVALDLFRAKTVERFVTADKDLLAVVAAEGMVVLDPEKP